jgi:hypothetical protein
MARPALTGSFAESIDPFLRFHDFLCPEQMLGIPE